MEHNGTIKLESDRLILRQFELADAQKMYDNWASNPTVTQYLSWPTHENVEETEKIIADWVDQYDNVDFYQWAICLKEDPFNPIGSMSITRQEPIIRMGLIGYCIGEQWWGKGYASEALARMMEYLFDIVGFNRLQGEHDPHNAASGHVMEKNHMRHEGTLRQASFNNYGIIDVAIKGILRQDYLAIKGTQSTK